MFSVVGVHRADVKPGPSHTVSHTSHIPSPALPSSETHTIQAVAVSVTGQIVGGLIFLFYHFSSKSYFLHAVCQKKIIIIIPPMA